MIEALTVSPLLQGLVFAVLGVSFWFAGVLVMHWLWKYYRGEPGPDADAGTETGSEPETGSEDE